MSGTQLLQQDTLLNSISPFRIPSSKFSRICTDSPIRFKVDHEDSCLTKNNALNCGLIGHQAFNNIQIDTTGEGNSFVSPTIACYDTAGGSITCSSSNFGSGTCSNSIINSRYIITTDQNTGFISQGIYFLC